MRLCFIGGIVFRRPRLARSFIGCIGKFCRRAVRNHRAHHRAQFICNPAVEQLTVLFCIIRFNGGACSRIDCTDQSWIHQYTAVRHCVGDEIHVKRRHTCLALSDCDLDRLLCIRIIGEMYGALIVCVIIWEIPVEKKTRHRRVPFILIKRKSYIAE